MATNPFDQFDAPSGGMTVAPNPTLVAREEEKRERERRGEQRSEEQLDISQRGEAFSNASSLRKEFNALPAVTDYNVALGTYNSALGAKPTPQGDQSLITAYAKMLDPNSVVREGEFAVTASTEGILNQVKARLAKEFGWEEGGMLTPEGREAVRGEMRNLVVNRFKPAYEGARQQYEFTAREFGVDPAVVIGQHVETRFPEGLLADTSASNTLAAPGSGIKLEDTPPAYQQAYEAFVRSGNWTPEQYAAFRSRLDKSFFPDAADQTDIYLQEAPRILERVQQGLPLNLTVPGVETQMGVVEGALNSAAQSPLGAFAANMGNAGAFGLPARLAGGQDELQALREQRPLASFMGELAGGVTGAGGAGAGLRAAGIAAPHAMALGNLGFGGVYGATQDTENPYRGAAFGLGSAALGTAAGGLLGRNLPRVFNPRGVAAADASVPTNAQLRQQAKDLYTQAGNTGERALPEQTGQLTDRLAAILGGEGVVSPRGRFTADMPKVKAAVDLIDDFTDEVATPTQLDAVRKRIGDAVVSQDPSERRLGTMLRDEFDAWADETLAESAPLYNQARGLASRYLRDDTIQEAIGIGEARGRRLFSQSGADQSLRTKFGQLHEGELAGRERFTPAVTQAIANTAEGTPASNIGRYFGKLAPTGVVSSIPTMGAYGVGGLPAAAGMAGLGMAGRGIANASTRRNAELASLLARGGDEYEQALEQELRRAARRGGIFGAGMAVPATSTASR